MSDKRRARPRDWEMVWLGAAVIPIIAYLLFPVLVVMVISFSSGRYLEFPPPSLSLKWYRNFFESPQWWGSALTSLQIAPIATVLATLIGTMVSFPLVRSRFAGRQLLLILILSALIVPSVVKATSFYLFYARLNLIGSILTVAVAHTVSALPFVVITVAASLRSFDENLERAAQVSGASPVESVVRITLPIIAPAIFAGAFLAFLSSLQELLVSMFLLGTTRSTLPIQMWNSVVTFLDPTIPAASTLLVLMTVVALVSSNVLAARVRRLVIAARAVEAG